MRIAVGLGKENVEARLERQGVSRRDFLKFCSMVAVTMGMGDIMRAKSLLLIISGNKQDAARELLMNDRITTACPATFMKLHRDATVFIEKKLADEIGYKG